VNKPNILLIMSDEHHARVMGCSGDAIVDTPHLDRLAANGIVFDNC
jgi:choline-sulfatase